MKNTGIVRRVDNFGRITPPMEFRRALDISEGDEVEISLQGNTILMKKHENTCVFCESKKNIKYFKGKYICSNCQNTLASE